MQEQKESSSSSQYLESISNNGSFLMSDIKTKEITSSVKKHEQDFSEHVISTVDSRLIGNDQ